MYQPHWIKFVWDLTSLPTPGPQLDTRYKLDRARDEDRDLVWSTMERAFSTEQAWSSSLAGRLDFLRQVMAYDFNSASVEFWTLRHGARLIGISALAEEHACGYQLVTGISIQNEYRCRGLGTCLLYESLARLKTLGATQATAIAKKNVTAEKFLYRKFGSVASTAPAPEPILARAS